MKKSVRINNELKAMFDCFEDSMIVSCFEGIYGELLCDDENCPQTAMIISGDFHYITGKVQCCDEIMSLINDNPNVVIVPSGDEWFDALNGSCGNRLKKVERFHMRLGQKGFDKNTLSDMVEGIDHLKIQGCELCEIGESEYNECLRSDWAYSFVSNFSDYSEYKKHGFGFVIKSDSKVISGTSSFGYYSKGVEIEVSTAPDYRRNGLARITSARFILECLDRKLIPHWDARNMTSVNIASKLGFELIDSYTAYEFKKA